MRVLQLTVNNAWQKHYARANYNARAKMKKRKWLEAIEIAKHQNVLFNRDTGRTLPDSYNSIIKKSWHCWNILARVLLLVRA